MRLLTRLPPRSLTVAVVLFVLHITCTALIIIFSKKVYATGDVERTGFFTLTFHLKLKNRGLGPIGPAASQIVGQGNTVVSHIASTAQQVASSVEAAATNALDDISHQNLSISLGTRKLCVGKGEMERIEVLIPHTSKRDKDSTQDSGDDNLDQAITLLGSAAKIFGLKDAGSLLAGVVKMADGRWLTPPQCAQIAIIPALLSCLIHLVGLCRLNYRGTEWLHLTTALVAASLSILSFVMLVSLWYIVAEVNGLVADAAGKAGAFQSGPCVRDLCVGMIAAASQVIIAVFQALLWKIHHYWIQAEGAGKTG